MNGINNGAEMWCGTCLMSELGFICVPTADLKAAMRVNGQMYRVLHVCVCVHLKHNEES